MYNSNTDDSICNFVLKRYVQAIAGEHLKSSVFTNVDECTTGITTDLNLKKMFLKVRASVLHKIISFIYLPIAAYFLLELVKNGDIRYVMAINC